MAYDLDDVLSYLASAPVHKGLLTMDDEVLRRIAGRSSAQANLAGTLALAGFIAIGLGVASVGLPGHVPAIAPTLSPFSPLTPLAPSTLLGSVH